MVVKRAFLICMLIACLFIAANTVEAATRMKKGKTDKKVEPVVAEKVAEPVVEIVKQEPRKKDISDTGLRKLQKM